MPLVKPEATEEIAIAHDYLTQRGGAERVVLAMHRAFPDAPIYTTLYDPEGTFPEFKDAKIITSPLNKIGYLRRNHRMALPILPIASSFLKVPAERAVVSTTGGRTASTSPAASSFTAIAGAMAVLERSVPGREEHRSRAAVAEDLASCTDAVGSLGCSPLGCVCGECERH